MSTFNQRIVFQNRVVSGSLKHCKTNIGFGNIVQLSSKNSSKTVKEFLI